ncbi:MAG: hypothetical protein EXX96DRAFT_275728 [Benjaminiella poitrasii]|nr:MAG: hypothetical protein EXX96DRAFT_275728 [Benjaminiella poitrasii]
MKIEKPSFRKIDTLPPALETVIWHLVNDDLDQIAKWANLDSWTYPKGDLFQYIKVLNRFDTILETVCQEHELIDTIQRKPFENKTKKMVSAILNFSKLLLENCKNRNIYNSCEHLNNLLNTTDLDILQKTLQLIMIETIRFSSSRSNQLHFKIQQEKIRKLIVGGSISNLLSAHPSTISNKVKMSFYLDDQNSKEEREIIDVKIIPNAYTDHELFWKLVDDRMPKGYHLELLSRIRMANYITEKSVINQLLIIRFILIALTAHTMSETIAQNKVFIFTPSLVSQIAQFITYNNDVSMDVQTYALYALRGIAMHRTKIQEVLTVFNASANHGVLLHILRQLPHSNPHYTLEFLDAFFALLRFLVLNPIGGTMLMSAGIMSTLVQVINHLDNGDPLHKKVMTKAIKLLIVIMNNINSAFSSFLSANGLDILLKIIQKQVDRCIEQSLTLNAPLTIDSAGVIKEILRFMNHTRDYENTGESLHNLIESSLPHTLKKIMENYKLFKPKACALAFTIMSTFIHNEPTSLTVLQEIGLPQIFLKTFQLYDECNVEVLMAAAHTFGAICLNSTGLNMLVETDTLPHFFRLLASMNFINTIHDMGSIELLGLAMDELIRHQPSLKIKVFECTNQLLLYATTLGHSEEGKPSDNSHQLTYEKSSQKEDVECFLMDYIHLVSEFLGGFFKNPENIKEFVKYKGPELLLQYYAFPMLPYNFFLSNGFHKLNQLFQTVAGSSPVLIAKLIIQRLYETSRFLFTDLDVKKSVIYECIEANGKDNEISNQANILFCKFKSLFGYVGLLSSVMTPSSISKGNKHAPKLLEWFLESYEDYDSIIQLVGEIHRIIMWQNILLRESAPKSWYSTKLIQSSPEETDDLKDPQAINMTRFKTIISEVSPALLPVLLSVIKISTSRKTTNSKQLLNMRCKRVAHKIAKLFNSHLNYLDCPDIPDCKYSYYASIFSMASMVLLGHNSQGILQTHIAIAFEGLGTVDLLINTFLPKFWKVLELQLETDQQDERLIQRINTCIETTLSIPQQLGSPRLIFESPNTSILTDDDLDERSNMKPFNPEYWLAVIHLKLSGLYIYLQSPVLLKVSGRVLNSILGCVKQGLIYDRPRIDTNRNRRALILMGFSPELVDQALDRFEYAICALDYLFSRRLTSHRVESGPPQLGPLEQIDSTYPLTPSEFAAGLRILVNMWYDPILARRALMMFNNLAEAEKMLAKQGDPAIRVPWQNTRTQGTTTELIVHEENDIDNNDDDQYEDIDSDESLAEDESNDTLCWKEISQYAEKFSVYSVSNEYIKLIHQLDEIHQLIRANTPVIFASLTDKRDDLDIEIRDIMAALCCGNVSDKVKSMEQVMHLFFKDVDMDRSTRYLVDTPINRIRIFALMLREPIIKDVIAQLVINISKFIDWSAFLDLVASYSTFPDSKWMTILSLILEIFLALSDEPADILPHANKTIVNQEVSLADIPRPMPITALLDQKEALLKNCVQLLKMDHLPEDNLVAVLRIIVRLTKHHDLATSFVQMDGLETLLARPGTEFTLFKLQRDYIILILRHILESPLIVMESMSECIRSACHNRNGQIHSIFISDILKDNYSLLYRDPTLYLETSSLLFRLTSRMDSVYLYDGIDNNKLEDNDAKYKYKDLLTNMNDNSSSDFVINFLLRKISDTLENDIEQNDITMAYVGLLLQSVLELILSYPSCKSNVIRFDISINIDDSADTILDAVLRKSILYKLITRLLPYNLLTDEASDLERKKQSISMWIVSIIVGLCYNAKKYDRYVFNDKDTQVKIQRRIRDFVVRIIALSFSDMLRSNENIIRKYLHYYVLAGLCDHILYARVKPMTPSLSIMQEDVTDIAVLMLNKNYISLLISAMDDVNVDFPHAKTILTSILRPLEQLTKINIRTERHLIERVRNDSETPVSFESTSVVRRDHERNEEEQGEEEEQDMLIPMDINEDDDASEEEEVNNLYRNSSLAMFDGVVQDEESDEENYNDDIEMASSGEEVIETSSDDQYDTESDTDMESDERDEVEEEDEDQEMEDLIRSHRYHHSDTEEEEEEEREHDDDEDDSGSSDESSMHSSEFYDSHSYSSSDESLDSDRSDSYYSEVNQVTWPLNNTNEEFASPNNNHRHEGVVEVDTSSDNNSYTTNDEEDENSSSFYDEIELNPEELQNVEDNLRLFFNEPSSNPSRASFVNSNANATRNFRSYDNDRIGRPLVRNDAILHPLFKSANALTAATGYRALNNTADHLQAYEDIIGHNAARILENMFLTIQREENTSPSGQTENSADSTSATSTEGKTEKESQLTLSILKDFMPMTTVKRWTQEAQMIYSPSVAVERAVNMRSLLSDALSMNIKKEEESTGDENEVEQSNGFTIEIEADRDTINDLFNANMDAAIVFEEENPDEDEEPTSHDLRGNDNLHQAQPLPSYPSPPRSGLEFSLPVEFGPQGNTHGTFPPAIIEDATDSIEAVARSPDTPADISVHHDAPRIVDLFELMSLVRLLFAPQSVSKTPLNRLLLNLCKNSKTRRDLLSLLVYILQMGTSNMESVDRSFKKLFPHQKGKKGNKSTNPVNSPSLITQRCLEILYYIVTWNGRSMSYFFVKRDIVAHLKSFHSTGPHKTKNDSSHH